MGKKSSLTEIITIIIELVDSTSRDGPDTPYNLYNTLEKPKYLRASKLVKFLTNVIIISSKFLSDTDTKNMHEYTHACSWHQYHRYCMSEPGIKKKNSNLSFFFFLSFLFPGLTQVCLNLSV